MIVLDREALPRERTKRRDRSAVAAPAGAVRRRRLRALGIKETLQIGRDPSSILIAVVLPLILLFLFGYGVRSTPTTSASEWRSRAPRPLPASLRRPFRRPASSTPAWPETAACSCRIWWPDESVASW